MKIRVFLTLIFVACFGQLFSQPKDSVKVVVSHILFCIDSITYQNLFHHEFIAKVFANTRELSSKTLTDSYTGKYLMGRQSYIEVFKPDYKEGKPELGDKFGDVGLVFRTKKPGEINKIDQLIRSDKKDANLKLMEYEDSGKIIPFNQNLYLSNAGLQETFRPYVEEFTVEFLKLCGFNESEIKSGITEEQFREKRRGKKYEKLYDNIEKIELILTKDEFEYLAETLKYLDFSQNGYRFTDNGLEISCSVQQNRSYKLKAIHFKLLNQTEDINIEISKNLTFRASGLKASFQFNYQ
jgi:hypothetical protein